MATIKKDEIKYINIVEYIDYLGGFYQRVCSYIERNSVAPINNTSLLPNTRKPYVAPNIKESKERKVTSSSKELSSKTSKIIKGDGKFHSIHDIFKPIFQINSLCTSISKPLKIINESTNKMQHLYDKYEDINTVGEITRAYSYLMLSGKELKANNYMEKAKALLPILKKNKDILESYEIIFENREYYLGVFDETPNNIKISRFEKQNFTVLDSIYKGVIDLRVITDIMLVVNELADLFIYKKMVNNGVVGVTTDYTCKQRILIIDKYFDGNNSYNQLTNHGKAKQLNIITGLSIGRLDHVLNELTKTGKDT